MKKIVNNVMIRVVISIIIGTILSAFICIVAIGYGYSYIKHASSTFYTVSILGVSIFEIQKWGNVFKGIPNNSNMMLIGIMCSFILIIVVECIRAFKSRKG